MESDFYRCPGCGALVDTYFDPAWDRRRFITHADDDSPRCHMSNKRVTPQGRDKL